jgi:hypothetical protein
VTGARLKLAAATFVTAPPAVDILRLVLSNPLFSPKAITLPAKVLVAAAF